MAARKSPAEGRKGDKLIRDALMIALKREAEGADGQKTRKLQLIAEKLVDKACEGDIAAIKEVADRVDGKSVQPIGGDSDDPVKLVVEILDATKRAVDQG